MSAAAPSPREIALPREGFAFLLSVVAHVAAAALIAWAGTRPVEPPPFEVTFLPGPPEPASPPPGEERPGPGTIAAPAAPEPVQEAPPAQPEPVPEPKKEAPPERPRPAPKPAKPVEDRGLLGALRQTEPDDSSQTRAFPGLDSPVRLRERPADAQAGGQDDAPARSEADVPVEERLAARPQQRSSGGRLDAGDAPLPGSGSGGPSAPGGGGTGRGGFSVTGAGAGGGGRSYQSIWDHTQQYISGLRWAYNRELRHDPDLRGVVLVRFEILSNGKVGTVRVLSSELDNDRFEGEVVSQIRRWTYPPEDAGDVVVTWPFSFLPPSS